MQYRKKIRILKALFLTNLLATQTVIAQEQLLLTQAETLAITKNLDSEPYAYFGDIQVTNNAPALPTISIRHALKVINQLAPEHTSLYLKNIISLIEAGYTTAPKQSIQNALEDACFILNELRHKLSPEILTTLANTLDSYYQNLQADLLTIDRAPRPGTSSSSQQVFISNAIQPNEVTPLPRDLFVRNIDASGNVTIGGNLVVTGSVIATSVIQTYTADIILHDINNTGLCVIFENGAGTMQGKVCAPSSGASGLSLTTGVGGGNIVANLNTTGALVANSTNAPSGNARGDNAVDLQLYRTAAAYVASGDFSALVGGQDNQAISDRSFVGGGFVNTATGDDSAVIGGRNNSALGNFSAIVGGATNTVSGFGSAIIGGGIVNPNTVDGDRSAVIAGYTNDIAVNTFDSAIAAGAFNTIANTQNAFIGGGQTNSISAEYAAIIGGSQNQATNGATIVLGGHGNSAGGLYSIVGGFMNTATTSAPESVVLGGEYNITASIASAVIGGYSNNAAGNNSAVIGGHDNTASSLDEFGSSVVVGGQVNNATRSNSAVIGGQGGLASGTSAGCAAVVGGYLNYATGDYSAVIGGATNAASTDRAAVIGGDGNHALGSASLIAGGLINTATGTAVAIVGGQNNIVTNDNTMIAGGFHNTASGLNSFIGSGAVNTAQGLSSGIIAGFQNVVTGNSAGIIVGQRNIADGDYAFVGGGTDNSATGTLAFIAGGQFNTATGVNSFAAGTSAQAISSNAFVWNSNGSYTDHGAQTFNVHAPGGIYLDGPVTGTVAQVTIQNLHVTGTSEFDNCVTITGCLLQTNGGVSLGADTTDFPITIGTNANTGRTVTIGSGVNTSALTLNAGTGDLLIGSTPSARTIKIGYAAANQQINLGTPFASGTPGTGTTVTLDASTTGTINIGSTLSAQTALITIGGTHSTTVINNLLTFDPAAASPQGLAQIQTGTVYNTLALQLSGTGSFILNSLNNASLGNARGPSAVDLQLSRSSAEHVASGLYSALLGGNDNTASAPCSAVIGGGNYGGSVAAGINTVIVGGSGHAIASSSTDSCIIAGSNNSMVGLTANDSLIGGGINNTVTSPYTAIVAGSQNQATAGAAVALGGYSNIAGGAYSVVCGYLNTTTDTAEESAIIGGTSNLISGTSSFIGGGDYNTLRSIGSAIVGSSESFIGAPGSNNVIAGGNNNTLFGGFNYRTIIGGQSNSSTAADCVALIGGNNNAVTGNNAVTLGGEWNTASGLDSFVTGSHNSAGGAVSFAAGQSAQANSNNTFVWNDGNGTYTDHGARTFNVHATGGIYLDGPITGTFEQITVQNLHVTGTSEFDNCVTITGCLIQTNGDVLLNAADTTAHTIIIGSQTNNSPSVVAINGSAIDIGSAELINTSRRITVGTTYGTGSETIIIGTDDLTPLNGNSIAITLETGTTGTINIGALAGSARINIGGTGSITDITGTFTQTNGDVSINNDPNAAIITIGAGAASKVVTLGSLTAESTLKLQASSATNGSLSLQMNTDGSSSIFADSSNTLIAGNTRGVNAVDLQLVRTSVSQVASGQNSALLGGKNNTASAIYSTAIGGLQNTASGYASVALGGGDTGNGNTAAGNYSAIIGGTNNGTAGTHSIIAGGEHHDVEGNYAGIFAGRYNQAQGICSVVLGGGGASGSSSGNNAIGDNSAIIGGINNTTSNSAQYSVIAGGSRNQTSLNLYNGVFVGTNNNVSGVSSVIAGGDSNNAGFNPYSGVFVGNNNTASGQNAVTLGGEWNTASGLDSFVTGSNSQAQGVCSFAAGHNAQATTNGSFVWADGQNSIFTDGGVNTFNVRAQGGMIVTGSLVYNTATLPVYPLGLLANGYKMASGKITGGTLSVATGITGVTSPSTGIYTITYAPSLFSQAPVSTGSLSTVAGFIAIDNIVTATATVRTYDTAGNPANADFTIVSVGA